MDDRMGIKKISIIAAVLLVLAFISAFQSVQDLNPQENMNMTEIIMKFGETEITAVLDDSETSKAFLDLLPLTLNMRRYADREYYAAIE